MEFINATAIAIDKFINQYLLIGPNKNLKFNLVIVNPKNASYDLKNKIPVACTRDLLQGFECSVASAFNNTRRPSDQQFNDL